MLMMAGTEEDIFAEDCVEETIENGENEQEEDQENDGQLEKTERIVRLPLTRIKVIMKTDPDVTLSSQDAVFLIAKATELFIQDFAKEVLTFTLEAKRKTVQRKDVDMAIEQNDVLAFLEGTLDS